MKKIELDLDGIYIDGNMELNRFLKAIVALGNYTDVKTDYIVTLNNFTIKNCKLNYKKLIRRHPLAATVVDWIFKQATRPKKKTKKK